MLNTPEFKRNFHIETLESEGIFLLSEEEFHFLKSQAYQSLIPLINGKNTVQKIIEILQNKISAAEIYYALMLMEQKGYIVEAFHELPSKIVAFLDVLKVDPIQAKNRLEKIEVSVYNCGNSALNLWQDELIKNLQSLNICVKEKIRETEKESFSNKEEIKLVITDDYLNPNLAAINQEALQLKRPWMLVKPVGKIIWIGPIFYPGKTGC